MYTIVVCDTEPIAVEGLRRLVQTGSFSLVAACTTLAGALDACRRMAPSWVLLDKSFGPQAVVDCLRQIGAPGQVTPGIVWGASFSEVESMRYVQAGARAVIRKTAALPLLMECFEAVAAGGTWMENSVPALRIHGNGRSPLTDREMQVRELVERGMKNKDIALALGIRTGTVKIHLKHIFEKTGIRGRYGLAISGLQEKGLLSLPAL